MIVYTAPRETAYVNLDPTTGYHQVFWRDGEHFHRAGRPKASFAAAKVYADYLDEYQSEPS